MSIWDWIFAAWLLGEFDHHEEYIDNDCDEPDNDGYRDNDYLDDDIDDQLF